MRAGRGWKRRTGLAAKREGTPTNGCSQPTSRKYFAQDDVLTTMGHRSGFFDQISGKHAGRYLRAVAFRRNHRGAFEGRVEKMFNSDGPLPLRMLFS